jgi:hypothetical protein
MIYTFVMTASGRIQSLTLMVTYMIQSKELTNYKVMINRLQAFESCPANFLLLCRPGQVRSVCILCLYH